MRRLRIHVCRCQAIAKSRSWDVQVLQGLCQLVLGDAVAAEKTLRSAKARIMGQVQLPKPGYILLAFSLEEQGKFAEAEKVLGWPG